MKVQKLGLDEVKRHIFHERRRDKVRKALTGARKSRRAAVIKERERARMEHGWMEMPANRWPGERSQHVSMGPFSQACACN